jgi:hypothetical protein
VKNDIRALNKGRKGRLIAFATKLDELKVLMLTQSLHQILADKAIGTGNKDAINLICQALTPVVPRNVPQPANGCILTSSKAPAYWPHSIASCYANCTRLPQRFSPHRNRRTYHS